MDIVGVTNEQHKDEDFASFIYEFVEKHGGIQEANRQLEEATKKNHEPPPSLTGPSDENIQGHRKGLPSPSSREQRLPSSPLSTSSGDSLSSSLSKC